MSDPKKPVQDEQALGKLLEAAFVIQEHRGEQRSHPGPKSKLDTLANEKNAETKPIEEAKKKAEAKPEPKTVQEKAPPTPVPEPIPAAVASDSSMPRAAASAVTAATSPAAGTSGKEIYALTLARIVEIQQQILAHGLALESAMALVAERAAEITNAGGAAVGILAGGANKTLRYRAASGRLSPAPGSEVAMEKALSFQCLRSGEVLRCGDVNSDLLLDAGECRRRGIASLIAVPIYRDSGITGALELYFASPHAFAEQDVHSCQLMAGLVTEALAREAGVSSRKSLASERATMLEALEKLRPNLAALLENPALKESLVKSAAAAPAAANSGKPGATMPAAPAMTVSEVFGPTADAAAVSPTGTGKQSPTAAVSPSSVNPSSVRPSSVNPTSVNSAPVRASSVFVCRKCGHDLVGEEMFCGKCGTPRSSEYEPPTMQSKLAAMWQRQQALTPGPAPRATIRPANVPAAGAGLPREQKNHHGIPAEIQPWEAVLSELKDPFADAEPELESGAPPGRGWETATPDRNEAPEVAGNAEEFAAGFDDAARQLSKNVATPAWPVKRALSVEETIAEGAGREAAGGEMKIEQPTGDRKMSPATPSGEDAIAPNWEEIMANALAREDEVGDAESHDEATAEETTGDMATTTALATSQPITWGSAAEAKAGFEQMAARNQNSFVRFWNTHRGDIYLAVAVVLVAGVVRWSIASDHALGTGPNAARTSHRRPAADADLSAFDRFLIALGLAEAPDPPEDKGNPDIQVWVDSRSALYYCPGADLYGKTPQGKYTTQRDAQLGQFEPAYRKACE